MMAPVCQLLGYYALLHNPPTLSNTAQENMEEYLQTAHLSEA